MNILLDQGKNYPSIAISSAWERLHVKDTDVLIFNWMDIDDLEMELIG